MREAVRVDALALDQPGIAEGGLLARACAGRRGAPSGRASADAARPTRRRCRRPERPHPRACPSSPSRPCPAAPAEWEARGAFRQICLTCSRSVLFSARRRVAVHSCAHDFRSTDAPLGRPRPHRPLRHAGLRGLDLPRPRPAPVRRRGAAAARRLHLHLRHHHLRAGRPPPCRLLRRRGRLVLACLWLDRAAGRDRRAGSRSSGARASIPASCSALPSSPPRRRSCRARGRDAARHRADPAVTARPVTTDARAPRLALPRRSGRRRRGAARPAGPRSRRLVGPHRRRHRAAAVLRRWPSARSRIRAHKAQFDGAGVVMYFLFAIAAMDGVLAARDRGSRPGRALPRRSPSRSRSRAFARRRGSCAALAPGDRFVLGYATGQRNMGLLIAALGAATPDTTFLFFALAQFPIYLMPQLVKPLARRYRRLREWRSACYPPSDDRRRRMERQPHGSPLQPPGNGGDLVAADAVSHLVRDRGACDDGARRPRRRTGGGGRDRLAQGRRGHLRRRAHRRHRARGQARRHRLPHPPRRDRRPARRASCTRA